MVFSTKLIRSEPLCPRPVGEANNANCRRVRTRPGTFRLDRQLVTALIATGFQDGTTGSGTHTRAKTVRFGPLPLIRLIGTLHKILFSKLSRCASRYPLGVAGALLGTILPDGTGPPDGPFEIGVW